jgi:hypothetical protein
MLLSIYTWLSPPHTNEMDTARFKKQNPNCSICIKPKTKRLLRWDSDFTTVRRRKNQRNEPFHCNYLILKTGGQGRYQRAAKVLFSYGGGEVSFLVVFELVGLAGLWPFRTNVYRLYVNFAYRLQIEARSPAKMFG